MFNVYPVSPTLPLQNVHVEACQRENRVCQDEANMKRKFKPFIANRVNEIYDVSTPEQWQPVPTSLNPFHEGSQEMEIHLLKPNCRWLSCATFLLQPEDQWPVQQTGNIPDNDKETRAGSHVTFTSHASALDLFL